MRTVTRDRLVAVILVLAWGMLASLLWRSLFLSWARALPHEVRLGVGLGGLSLCLFLAFFPVNALFHRLGYRGSFLEWEASLWRNSFRSRDKEPK